MMLETGSVVLINVEDAPAFVLWRDLDESNSDRVWVAFPVVPEKNDMDRFCVRLSSAEMELLNIDHLVPYKVKVNAMRIIYENRMSKPVGRLSNNTICEIQKKMAGFLFWRQPPNSNIPFALHDISGEELGEVADTLSSNWITTGPKTARFEKMFAQFVGAKHVLAVNSCTAALHLALEAAGVKKGDVVLTSPYTFTATAEVVRYLSADPVFVDIRPDTLNMNETLLEDAVKKVQREGKSVSAIIPVHFGGQACEMKEILNIAKNYGIRVIEDAAHALPCTSGGKMVGSIGDITAFSLYATKTITTGEGGMIATDDDDLACRMKIMRLHGISRDVWNRYNSSKPSWHYDVVEAGYKYNLTDIASAIGIEQLEKAKYFQKIRAGIAESYTEAFNDLPVQLPVVLHEDELHAWHLYPLLLNLEKLRIGRDRFIELIANEGIGTSVHFIPVHIHPYWRDLYGLYPEDFPVAFATYQREVSLPIFTRMSDNDVNRVIWAVRKVLIKYSR